MMSPVVVSRRCELCPGDRGRVARFSTRSTVARHYQVKHSMTKAQANAAARRLLPLLVIQCSVCTSTLSSQRAMKVHLEAMHDFSRQDASAAATSAFRSAGCATEVLGWVFLPASGGLNGAGSASAAAANDLGAGLASGAVGHVDDTEAESVHGVARLNHAGCAEGGGENGVAQLAGGVELGCAAEAECTSTGMAAEASGGGSDDTSMPRAESCDIESEGFEIGQRQAPTVYFECDLCETPIARGGHTRRALPQHLRRAHHLEGVDLQAAVRRMLGDPTFCVRSTIEYKCWLGCDFACESLRQIHDHVASHHG